LATDGNKHSDADGAKQLGPLLFDLT